ncbi:MAG: DnaJ domain-containing protein [Deltaproteobacteria bacterium]|nr:DnaJ domain-containing protein [Deltaproteobacteria bacterium]
MGQRDYYEILGIGRRASQKEIKEVYRKLALKYHPDRNQDEAAATRMKEINEAYAVLAHPEKRQEYDSLRDLYGSSAHSQFRQAHTEQDIFRGSDIHHVFEEISRAFGLRGFDDIFREFYGPGYRSFEFRRPGAFGRGFVFRGSFGRGPRGAAGAPLGGPFGKLLKYALKRQLGVEIPEKGNDRQDTLYIPLELALKGGKIRYLYRSGSRELVVSIPRGIREGQKIRLRGMGDEGKGGGESGDLYVTVRIRKPLLQTIKEFGKRLLKGKG